MLARFKDGVDEAVVGRTRFGRGSQKGMKTVAGRIRWRESMRVTDGGAQSGEARREEASSSSARFPVGAKAPLPYLIERDGKQSHGSLKVGVHLLIVRVTRVVVACGLAT